MQGLLGTCMADVLNLLPSLSDLAHWPTLRSMKTSGPLPGPGEHSQTSAFYFSFVAPHVYIWTLDENQNGACRSHSNSC